MRIFLALAAATALTLSACARSPADETDAAAAEDTQQELAEAGEAVGEAAVEVGQAARHVVEDAAESVDENNEQTKSGDEPAER